MEFVELHGRWDGARRGEIKLSVSGGHDKLCGRATTAHAAVPASAAAKTAVAAAAESATATSVATNATTESALFTSANVDDARDPCPGRIWRFAIFTPSSRKRLEHHLLFRKQCRSARRTWRPHRGDAQVFDPQQSRGIRRF
jgi:hypothetical protein